MQEVKARLMGKQRFVSLEELAQIPTPEAEGICRPVSHIEAVETVREQVGASGWGIVEERYGLVGEKGEKLFGVMTIESQDHPDWRHCIGIRNSHDKSIRLGVCAGLSVIVCSNLCFGGNKTVQRKHTTRIDVKDVVRQAFQELPSSFEILEKRMNELKSKRITDDQARAILVHLAAAEAIPSCDILNVFNEYKEPRHPEFEGEYVWDLFNAVTEISHKYSPVRADRTHTALTRAFGLDGDVPGLKILSEL